ncbi:MAG: F0F1 ATP synthase subunit B [SAR202 cluster bacterium]|nr:F0F1 ATP synthase subunit B [SAR202 cluster bacterium]|tara:strand:- start:823 stop:1362 length:540 start_codon:yes stop_codon:yes gene_type:complete
MLGAPLLEEASGIGALGIDLTSLLVYLINFTVLGLILYFMAYKRIIGMLDSRSERIRESLEEADRVRKESEEQQESMQKALDDGRQEGQRVLAEAREAAERYREQQAEQARAESEQIVSRAREEIKQERDAALESVRAEFAVLAVSAAEKIIKRSLDADAQQDLIDEVISESNAKQEQD